jgi:hypothetical protein
VILLEPLPTAVAKPRVPPLLIMMAAVFEDAQVAVEVKSWVLKSVNVPVATNCCVAPIARSTPVGVTAIDTSVAAVTVSVAAFEVMPLDTAVIADVPMLSPVALPFEPAALLMLATAVLAGNQVAVVVKSWVLLSVNVPIAVNCCVNPLAMLGLVGVTAIDASAAAVTVKVVEPEIVPNAAVISEEPVVAVVARPLLPAALLIVATDVVADIHVTRVVRFWVLLSV